jgi:Icc protein
VPINRRDFLKTTAAWAAVAALPGAALLSQAAPAAAAPAAPGSFDFIFFTDAHIQPELDAAHGCDMCFRKIAGIHSDFAINGGDHVFDALAVSGSRASMLFDLYAKTQRDLRGKLYHTIGNHDVFGIFKESGVAPSDPLYAKKMFQDRIGTGAFYSFDHKGYHFIVLDSIQPTQDRQWEARIDDAQMQWLAGDLKMIAPRTPVVVVVHVPLVTSFASYANAGPSKYNTTTVANAPDVLLLLANYNVIAVLQGHTHINELVLYKQTQYITSGAVCGNWWMGPRWGFPEGFTVVSLRAGKLATRYETYGFHSVAPQTSLPNGPWWPDGSLRYANLVAPPEQSAAGISAL